MQVNRGATETGTASEEVLNSAKSLSTESTRLREETRPLHGEYPARLELTI